MTEHKKFLIASLLLLLTACSPFKATETDLQPDADAIIGGIDIPEDHELSHSIVAVYNHFSKSMCTGSLTKNNIVITAAHCVPEDLSHVFIIFTTNLTHAEKLEHLPYRTVDKAEISPYYEKNKMAPKDQGDLALLRFTGSAPESYIPISMLLDASVLQKNVPVIVAGYGINEIKTRRGTGVLRAAYLKILDPDFSNTEISVDQSQGQSACHGDSGGPAYVYNTKTKTFALWGVTSRADNDPTDECSKVVIYTNLSAHLTWLNEASKRLTTSVRDLIPQQ